MVEQAKEYIKDGLLECEAISKFTKQVMTDNDYIATFLDSDMDKSYHSFSLYMKQFAPKEILPSVKEYERRIASESPLLR